MSVLIEQFIAFFMLNAPVSMQDDFWPAFVGICLLSIIFSFLTWLIRTFAARFESDKARSVVHISSLVFVFIFLITLEFLNPGEASRLDSMPLLILITVGFCAYGIYGVLKGKKDFVFSKITDDRNLKEGDEVRKGEQIVLCSSCHKKTISLSSAYYSPQTCGECGDKSISLAADINHLVIAFSSILLFVILILKLNGFVSTETTVWMIMFTMILYIMVAMIILWRVKVATPYRPVYLFKFIRLY